MIYRAERCARKCSMHPASVQQHYCEIYKVCTVVSLCECVLTTDEKKKRTQLWSVTKTVQHGEPRDASSRQSAGELRAWCRRSWCRCRCSWTTCWGFPSRCLLSWWETGRTWTFRWAGRGWRPRSRPLWTCSDFAQTTVRRLPASPAAPCRRFSPPAPGCHLSLSRPLLCIYQHTASCRCRPLHQSWLDPRRWNSRRAPPTRPATVRPCSSLNGDNCRFNLPPCYASGKGETCQWAQGWGVEGWKREDQTPRKPRR